MCILFCVGPNSRVLATGGASSNKAILQVCLHYSSKFAVATTHGIWLSIFPGRENIGNLRNLIKTLGNIGNLEKAGKTNNF